MSDPRQSEQDEREQLLFEALDRVQRGHPQDGDAALLAQGCGLYVQWWRSYVYQQFQSGGTRVQESGT